jgi:putative PIN family toxin of toxin-antitoxin system
MLPQRVVFDTNAVISALLFANSVPGKALVKAQNKIILASEATLLELIAVVERPKWDRYVERELRTRLVAEYIAACKTIPIPSTLRVCRDPKDDKFLDVAINGHADTIVSGDQDLLVLNPFRGISILTPAQYLQQESHPV